MPELYSSKDPLETATCTMNFAPDVERVGGALTACVVDVLREDGVTEDTTAMVAGVCDVSATPVVKQNIAAGNHGVRYLIRYRATINGLPCVASATMLVRNGGG